ncbi:MAG: pirin family protein [Sumerlaeia bacterium]
MLTLRKSAERGAGNHGWLQSHHTFSFAGYFDPKHMNFRSLRVINEDHIQQGRGFGLHPHDNMEILTYVVRGHLAHKDTAGHEAVVGRGGVQFMSAGSGIAHSEYNASRTDPVHLLQIWILPAEQDTEPRYQDRTFDETLDGGGLVPLASPDGRGGSIRIGQDVVLSAARPAAGAEFEVPLAPGRAAWIQVISGCLTVHGQSLAAGDALAVEDEAVVRMVAETAGEFLLFDLA